MRVFKRAVVTLAAVASLAYGGGAMANPAAAFTSGLQSHGDRFISAINFSGLTSSYVGENGRIVTQDLKFSSGTNTLGENRCKEPDGALAPCTLDDPLFPGHRLILPTMPVLPGAASDVVVANFQTANVNAGKYGAIVARSNSTLNVNSLPSSTTVIESIQLDGFAQLKLSPGDYWIQNLTVGAQAKIITTGSGTVRLFLLNQPTLSSFVTIAGNATSDLVLVRLNANGTPADLNLGINKTVAAVGYVTGKLTAGNQSKLSGAFSAQNIVLEGNATVTEDRTRLIAGAVDWGSIELNPVALDFKLLDIDRSLLVNEKAVLDFNNNFALEKTFAALAGGMSANQPLTAAQLGAAFWKLEHEGVSDQNNFYCATNINGWPQRCTRSLLEGEQYLNPAAAMALYKPLALVNRVDLMTPDEAAVTDCGEYRIVYGRRDDPADANRRTFIIFEARTPNPHPELGEVGCVEIQQYWAALSDIDSVAERSEKLRAFYFDGIVLADGTHYSPVMSVQHFQASSEPGGPTGQIRTNQFLNPDDNNLLTDEPWVLKDYRLRTTKPYVVQEAVGNTPPATLFDLNDQSDVANAYRLAFLEEGDIFRGTHFENLINKNVLSVSNPQFSGNTSSRRFDFSESYSSPKLLVTAEDFEHSQLRAAAERLNPDLQQGGRNFLMDIEDKLTDMNRLSPDGVNCVDGNPAPDAARPCLTPTQVVNRAISNTCAGCHQPLLLGIGGGGQLSPLLFPNTLGPNMRQPDAAVTEGGFVHIKTNLDATGQYYEISAALRNEFLPERKKSVECFLNSHIRNEVSKCDGVKFTFGRSS